jgi:hypothetical protein
VSYVRTGCPDGPDAEFAASRSQRVETARVRYRDFHARCPTRTIAVRCRRTVPDVLVQLGHLRALIYSADRGDGGTRSYIHFMERQPLLTCNADGTQLYILGGRYRVTRRGIEG